MLEKLPSGGHPPGEVNARRGGGRDPSSRSVCTCSRARAPHVMLVELRQALISYQGYHMLLLEHSRRPPFQQLVGRFDANEVSVETLEDKLLNPLHSTFVTLFCTRMTTCYAS